MTTTQNKGTKFDATRDLDTTAVAALVRADIKALRLAKGFKVSVRTSYASMMSAIDVRITAVPAGFEVRVAEELVDGFRADGLKCPWLTREAVALVEQLEEIVEAYNRTASDPQSDYYNTRFYGGVEFAVRAPRAVAPAAPAAAPVRSAAVIEAEIAVLETKRAANAAEIARLDAEGERIAFDMRATLYLSACRELNLFAGVA